MFLDILFPKYCIGCNKMGPVLCYSCRKELRPTIQDVCPYCFRNSPEGRTHEQCQKRNGLDGAISVLRYTPIARKIVKSIKYKLAYDIFNQVAGTIPKHWWRTEVYSKYSRQEIVIQPIPLHKARKNMRGFNQAEVIADYLSKQTGISKIDTLKRVKNTPPQAMIQTKQERAKNIKGAFAMKNKHDIRGKNILLVDDLFTSGSTAKEAADVLRKAGAKKIFLYTFAHGS